MSSWFMKFNFWPSRNLACTRKNQTSFQCIWTDREVLSLTVCQFILEWLRSWGCGGWFLAWTKGFHKLFFPSHLCWCKMSHCCRDPVPFWVPSFCHLPEWILQSLSRFFSSCSCPCTTRLFRGLCTHVAGRNCALNFSHKGKTSERPRHSTFQSHWGRWCL